MYLSLRRYRALLRRNEACLRQYRARVLRDRALMQTCEFRHLDFEFARFLSVLRDMFRSHVWHDWFMSVTRRSHKCDVTHSYARRDLRDVNPHMTRVWHDSFTCVTPSSIWVTRLILECELTHSCVWHDSFICVTCLIYMGDTSPLGVSMSHTWTRTPTWDMPCHVYEWVMSHIWMSHVTHMNESCHTHEPALQHETCLEFALEDEPLQDLKISSECMCVLRSSWIANSMRSEAAPEAFWRRAFDPYITL